MYRLLCIASLLAAFTATAGAQPVESVEPHQGLFVRLTPGLAGSAATADVDDTTLTLQGGAGRLGISVGWAIQPRLIITGELLGHAVLGPELERDGATTETDDDVVWGISYAGVGVNYYFPSNLYLVGSGGPLRMTLDSDQMDTAKSELGFAAKIGVGREWWVAPKIGIGVGIELLAGYVPDGDTGWGVSTLGLDLSVTYN